ncbi:hypothetical protein ACTFIU_005056 [Dictyostelium citrinum]
MSDSSNNKNDSNIDLYKNINSKNFENVEIPNRDQFQNFQQHNNYFQQQQQEQQEQQQKNYQTHQYNPYGNRDTSYNPYKKEDIKDRNSLRQQQQLHFIKKQNEIVSSHYDNKQNTPIHIRAQSKIISLKNINNWVKSMLIQEYSKPNTIVFDICGGKLGDLQKWIKAQIKTLIVSDISLESLKHGLERYNQKLNYIHFNITMIAADCFSSKLLDVFPKQQQSSNKKKKNNKNYNNNNNEEDNSSESENDDQDDDDDEENVELLKVNLVSCQFALHYSFRTEESARSLLKNVSTVLEDGGHFIGTIPNSCLIVKKLRESKSNRFGNDVFKIEFKEKEPKFSAFGCAYNFFLEDAIDFLEEYLVHIDVLVELARDYQLELVSHSNFHDLIYEKSKSKPSHDLLRKMNCFNSNNTISQAEWEALGIYKTFVFKKIGTRENSNNNNNNKNSNNNNNDYKAKSLSNDDIIVNL